MATGYYLQDNQNPEPGQFGWPRTRVSGVIGVHTAENQTDFEGADPGAEDVAGFIGRRTDYGSYHALADADSRIKLVHPRYAAWADTTNNAHAMSVSGAMQAARWRELSPDRAAALTRNMAYAAAELVQDAIAAGLLAEPTPARRITPAEAISGSRAGFYGHGETNPGTRYDPGQNFDWELFLATYASAIGGGINYQNTTTLEEIDMAAVDKIYEFTTTLFRQYHEATIAKIYDFTTTLAKQYHEAGINETRAALRDAFKAYAEAQPGNVDAGQLAIEVARKFDAILDAGVAAVDVPATVTVDALDVPATAAAAAERAKG